MPSRAYGVEPAKSERPVVAKPVARRRPRGRTNAIVRGMCTLDAAEPRLAA